MNLLTADTTGGFKFGIGQGRASVCQRRCRGRRPARVDRVRSAIGTTLAGAGKLFGLDILGALDLAESDGLVTTLAEPNLTALSGETASFLAGGEFPIPLRRAWARSRSSTSNMASAWPSRRPCSPMAASRCGSARKSPNCRRRRGHAQRLRRSRADHPPRRNHRRARLRPELHDRRPAAQREHNNVDKAPGLGDLPILGALFRSTSFQRAKPSW